MKLRKEKHKIIRCKKCEYSLVKNMNDLQEKTREHYEQLGFRTSSPEGQFLEAFKVAFGSMGAYIRIRIDLMERVLRDYFPLGYGDSCKLCGQSCFDCFCQSRLKGAIAELKDLSNGEAYWINSPKKLKKRTWLVEW